MFLPKKRMVKTASSFAVYNLSEKLDIRKPKVTPKSLAACPTGTNPMAVVTPIRYDFNFLIHPQSLTIKLPNDVVTQC